MSIDQRGLHGHRVGLLQSLIKLTLKTSSLNPDLRAETLSKNGPFISKPKVELVCERAGSGIWGQHVMVAAYEGFSSLGQRNGDSCRRFEGKHMARVF